MLLASHAAFILQMPAPAAMQSPLSSASELGAGSVTANLQDIRHKVESSQGTFASVVGVLDAATKRLRELRREQEVSEHELLFGPFVSSRVAAENVRGQTSASNGHMHTSAGVCCE